MSIYTTGSLELRSSTGDHLFVTASRDSVGPKIGIGTTGVPTATFTIKDDLSQTDDADKTRIVVANTATNGEAHIHLGQTSTNRGFMMFQAGSGNNKLRLGTKTAAGSNLNTLVLQDGRVGIGGIAEASSPAVDLHVQGTNKAVMIGENVASPAGTSTLFFGNASSFIQREAGVGGTDGDLLITAEEALEVSAGEKIQFAAAAVSPYSLLMDSTGGGQVGTAGHFFVGGSLYDNNVSSGNQHINLFPGGGSGESNFVQTRFYQVAAARVGLHVTGSTRLKGNVELHNTSNSSITIDAMAGTDQAGKSLTLGAGQSTGAGAGGSLAFQVARRGAASGASVNSFRTAMVLTDDGSSVEPGATFSGNVTVSGPTFTVGDGAEEDQKIILDGNAADYYVGIDDSDDSLMIGVGSTVGTTPALQVKGTAEQILKLPTHIHSLGLGGTGGVEYPEGVFCIANAQRLRFNDGAELEDASGHKRLDLTDAGSVNIYGKAAGISLVVSGTVADGVGIEGNLQVTGHNIKNAAGENTITLDLDQKVGIGGITPSHMLDVNGDLRVRGNDIRDSGGNPAITFDGSNNTDIKGTLKLTGNVIQASDGGTTITLDDDDNVAIGGDLRINGNDIKGSDGDTIFTLSSTTAKTITSDLTIEKGGYPQLKLRNTSTVSTSPAALNLERAPTDNNITTDDLLGSLSFRGTEGSNYYSGAAIDVVAVTPWDTENASVGSRRAGSQLSISTTPRDGTVPVENIVVDGGVSLGNDILGGTSMQMAMRVGGSGATTNLVHMLRGEASPATRGINVGYHGIFTGSLGYNYGGSGGDTDGLMDLDFQASSVAGSAYIRKSFIEYCPAIAENGVSEEPNFWTVTGTGFHGNVVNPAGSDLGVSNTTLTNFDRVYVAGGTSSADTWILEMNQALPCGPQYRMKFRVGITSTNGSNTGDHNQPESSDEVQIQYQIDGGTWTNTGQKIDVDDYSLTGTTAIYSSDGADWHREFDTKTFSEYGKTVKFRLYFDPTNATIDWWLISPPTVYETTSLDFTYPLNITGQYPRFSGTKGNETEANNYFVAFHTPGHTGNIGYIYATAAAPTDIVYAAFTGAHHGMLLEDVEEYDILVYDSVTGNITAEAEYQCVASTSDNQKNVIGVWNGTIDDRGLCGINAIGNGRVKVCSEGGNIEIGDLLVTSNTKGAGMKQSDDVIKTTTFAKSSQNVDWSTEASDTKIIRCIYICG